MVLRIEKVSDGPLMILRLSGRIQSEHTFRGLPVATLPGWSFFFAPD
jgi:hypothetical protein